MGKFSLGNNLAKRVSSWCTASSKRSILFTKPQNKINYKTEKLSYIPFGKKNLDVAYHGSPFNFDNFDITKIGTGEGLSKRGKGIYLFRQKNYAPYFANIRSKDAPLHIGSTKKLDNPEPRIYSVSGLNSINLKKVSELEAKSIAKNQDTFISSYPNIEGIELDTGEICIFPKAISKLKIKNKDTIENFILKNKGINFREWTTDKARLDRLEFSLQKLTNLLNS